MSFLGSETQMVVSEASAACFLNQITMSQLGSYSFNKQSIKYIFGIETDFDTNFIEPYFPIFKKKLGNSKKLQFNIGYNDMSVKFEFNQILLEFKMLLRLMTLSPDEDIMMDEYPMIVVLDAENLNLKTRLVIR